MKTLLVALAGVCLAASTALHAQTAAPSTAVTAGEGGAGRGGEPNVRRTVIEDEGARIEELRVRGETRRISVQSKLGGAPYEILPGGGGRGQAIGPTTPRGAAGERVWRVMQF